ncbi:Uncharacterised protein [uncultured archaeon]|nr:Uncharacterised protein [uncultured archaeon]
MTSKIKEIRILEPKIKEVKKEKSKEEIPEEEEAEEVDEEDLEDSVEISREEARVDLKKLILESKQEADKNLEQRVWNLPVAKKEEDPRSETKDFYDGKSNMYSDSKNLYTGSGDQRNSAYDAVPLGNEREDLVKQQKYLVEQRRDANPLEGTGPNSKKDMRRM